MNEKVLVMRKVVLALMMVLLSGWVAATAGLGTLTYAVFGVTAGLAAAFLLRRGQPGQEENPYIGLAAAYGSLTVTACALILLQAAQYHRESRVSPGFGYLIAAMLLPQVVFPAALRAILPPGARAVSIRKPATSPSSSPR